MPQDQEQRALLEEQIAYYQARAGEYDDWFFRRGRWDRGEVLNQRWFAEVEQVRLALHAFRPAGQVLELACGTGLWTEQLARCTAGITALDAVPEVLAINRARLGGLTGVRYVQADIFSWQPDAQYDMVFFGFWLSHVPPERFHAFWEMVSAALKPGGRVFFVDSAYDPTSTARDHRLGSPDATTVSRRLNDGREFRIVKVFYKPDDLARQLAEAGWEFDVRQTAAYFIYGSGGRRSRPGEME